MTNAYVDALQKKGAKALVLIPNKRAEIMKAQKQNCAICKKPLRPYYYNFKTDPKTKELRAICSDCSINIPKR